MSDTSLAEVFFILCMVDDFSEDRYVQHTTTILSIKMAMAYEENLDLGGWRLSRAFVHPSDKVALIER